MKKKNLKGLSLNKKSVSNLNSNQVIGGASDSPTVCQACELTQGPTKCTDGNCIQTWADPGCLTGIPWLCPNKIA